MTRCIGELSNPRRTRRLARAAVLVTAFAIGTVAAALVLALLATGV